ncbi:MAG: hypothetical protein KGL11_00255 [Alphaproteobacteria bacterium]|nr:hypothetical protein [Alphaproteobacteria bacterium]
MSDQPTPDARRPPLEVGLALLALGFLLAVAFQTVQLVRERINFATILLNQQAPLESTLKLRDRINALASDTAQLAQTGNAAAKQVVDDLARQHIALHPANAAGSSAPSP